MQQLDKQDKSELNHSFKEMDSCGSNGGLYELKFIVSHRELIQLKGNFISTILEALNYIINFLNISNTYEILPPKTAE